MTESSHQSESTEQWEERLRRLRARDKVRCATPTPEQRQLSVAYPGLEGGANPIMHSTCKIFSHTPKKAVLGQAEMRNCCLGSEFQRPVSLLLVVAVSYQ